MLTLKRRVQEQVAMYHNRAPNARVTLTVRSMLARKVALLIDKPGGVQDFLLLEQGTPERVPFMGHTVEIHLRAVVRGEARLGFVAPYEIKIERAERLLQQGNTDE